MARMARNAKNREKDRRPKPDRDPPLAGPHAKPELTDREKTAGTGMLPEPEEKDVRDEAARVSGTLWPQLRQFRRLDKLDLLGKAGAIERHQGIVASVR